jgi:hypothetical protein
MDVPTVLGRDITIRRSFPNMLLTLIEDHKGGLEESKLDTELLRGMFGGIFVWRIARSPLPQLNLLLYVTVIGSGCLFGLGWGLLLIFLLR